MTTVASQQRGFGAATAERIMASLAYLREHGKTIAVRSSAAAAALQLARMLRASAEPVTTHPGTAAWRRKHTDVSRVPESQIEHRFDAAWLAAPGAPRSFDFIVVGAGSAGCAMARRLSGAASATVLLVECGPEAQNAANVTTPHKMVSLWRSEVDWGLRSTPQEHLLPKGRVIDLERGKTLGGSSSINYMMFVRGSPCDFDRWATQYGAGDEWSHAGVLPSFRAIERVGESVVPGHDPSLRGADGPLEISTVFPTLPETNAFLESAEACGLGRTADYNGEKHEGFGPTQYSVSRGKRADAFNTFVEPVLRERPNLRVASEGFVRRVLFDAGADGAPRARGVELELPEGGRIELSATREVVLCAGAILSPQLLMLSGVGDREELAQHGIKAVAHVPAVGKNLQDHPYVPLFCKRAEPRDAVLSNGGLSGCGFLQTDVNRRREVKEGHKRGADAEIIFCSRIDASSYGPRALMHVKMQRLLPSLKTSPLLRPLYSGSIALAELLFGTEAARQDILTVFGISCEFNQPQARGTVRLASADPFAKPIVDLHLLDQRAARLEPASPPPPPPTALGLARAHWPAPSPAAPRTWRRCSRR